MARLDFKGKVFVENHHLAVPFHELLPVREKGTGPRANLDDNLIIHGDNLAALKALLPTYHGKVKCVYIDPPYNTGNEGWSYNDNVNSPLMRNWLGRVVDRDDLTRHDKWLCMMMPRLKLLRQLLADDGILFVSVDNNESHRLRMLLDEVFGEESFLNAYVWVNNLKGRQLSSSGAAQTHETVLSYAKDASSLGQPLQISVNMATNLMPDSYRMKEYPVHVDNVGPYVIKNQLYNTNAKFNEETRPRLVFSIHYDPTTQRVRFTEPNSNRCFSGFVRIDPKRSNDGVHQYHAWRWSKDKIRTDLTELHFEPYQDTFRVFTKVRHFQLTNLKDLITNIGDGGKTLKMIGLDFPSPKPPELIKVLVHSMGHPDAVVLDSFAGSGTTAHAVLALNKEDGGNRRFVLIECEDYADTVTAERVRRVIKGVPTARDKNLREGLGGGFSFFEVGQPMRQESLLDGSHLPSWEKLAGYVFFTATGREFDPAETNRHTGLVGKTSTHDVYLFYEPSVEKLKNLALTLDLARRLPTGPRRNLVFAPTKYLDREFLHQFKIDFQQLPFQIYEAIGEQG